MSLQVLVADCPQFLLGLPQLLPFLTSVSNFYSAGFKSTMLLI
jgi:hypothetical protein